VAVLPVSHPLAARAEVPAGELRGERLVAMRAGYLMHRFVHRLLGAEPPGECHSVDGAEMGKMMVAEGMGIALLPDYSVHGDPLERAGLIVARPIAGDKTTVSMIALSRRQARVNPIAGDMIQHLRDQARPRGDFPSGPPSVGDVRRVSNTARD
jgi:DNA-binding transcriptional LysR family regulator